MALAATKTSIEDAARGSRAHTAMARSRSSCGQADTPNEKLSLTREDWRCILKERRLAGRRVRYDKGTVFLPIFSLTQIRGGCMIEGSSLGEMVGARFLRNT